MAQTISLRFVIDSKGAVTGANLMVDSLDRVQLKAGKAGVATKKLGVNMNKLGTVARAMGLSIASAFGAIQFIQIVDKMKLLENRMRIVTRTTGELADVQKRLADISVETRSDLIANSDLFARLALSTKGQGVATKQLLDLTKSLNEAIVLSGATAREAEAGLIQLSQGLASGTLRGDELRSVLEQLPAVADIIATSLGVTRGRLRELGTEGAITAQVVLEAFEKLSGGLHEDFLTTERTVGQTLEQLKTRAIELALEFDNTTGATDALRDAIDFMRKSVLFLKDHIGILRFAAQVLTAAVAVATLWIGVKLVKAMSTARVVALVTGAAFKTLGIKALFAASSIRILIGSTVIGAVLVGLGILALKLIEGAAGLDKFSDEVEDQEESANTMTSAYELASLSVDRFNRALVDAEKSGGDMTSRLEVLRAGVEKLQDKIALFGSDELIPRRLSDQINSPDVARSDLSTTAGLAAFDTLSIEDSALSASDSVFILRTEIEALARAEKILAEEVKADPQKAIGENTVRLLKSINEAQSQAASTQNELKRASDEANDSLKDQFVSIESLIESRDSSARAGLADLSRVYAARIPIQKIINQTATSQKELNELTREQARIAKQTLDENEKSARRLVGLGPEVAEAISKIHFFDTDTSTKDLKVILRQIQTAKDAVALALQSDKSGSTRGDSSRVTSNLGVAADLVNSFIKENDKEAGKLKRAGERSAKAFAAGFAKLNDEMAKLDLETSLVGQTQGQTEDAKRMAKFVKDRKKLISDETVETLKLFHINVQLDEVFRRQLDAKRELVNEDIVKKAIAGIEAETEAQKLANEGDKKGAANAKTIAEITARIGKLTDDQIKRITEANAGLSEQLRLEKEIEDAKDAAEKKAKDAKTLNDSVVAKIESIKSEIRAREFLIAGKKEEAEIEEILFALGIANGGLHDKEIEQIRALITLTQERQAVLESITEKEEEQAELAGKIETAFATAFEDAILGAKSFEDALKGLIETLIQLAFRQLVIQQMLELFSNFGGTTPRNTSHPQGLNTGGAATGAIFGSTGNVIPFAKGGIITDTAIFPLSGGNIGVAGEAGIEAPMPVIKGADGNLSVNASGVKQPQNTTVVFNMPNLRTVDDFAKSRRQLSREAGRIIGRR